MNQYLIKEIQELRRQVNEFNEPTAVDHLEERLNLLEGTIKKMNDSITHLYNKVIEHDRQLVPPSESPETQPPDPDETRWE